MAVDTRNKRASCLGFALAALVILPAPDAVIDLADKQQVAASYAGLAPIDVTAEPGILDLIATAGADVELVGAASSPLDLSASYAPELESAVISVSSAVLREWQARHMGCQFV